MNERDKVKMGEVIKEDIEDIPKPPNVDRGYAWVILTGQ